MTAAAAPRRLLTTADDFGDTPGVNEAVRRAYREGVLRFASLMVRRPAAREAAAIAKENPGLGVGLHLELGERDPKAIGLRYLVDRRARAELEGEIRSQLDALRELGVSPTHVDGHMHVHAHPFIFPVLCRVAREYGVPRVRLPSPEWDEFKAFGGAPSWGRALSTAHFALMSAWVGGAARGLRLPRTWGSLRSGLMTEDWLVWLVERLPPGDTEIYFHPTADPALRCGPGPTATHQCVDELETLLSPRVRRTIERAGIELVRAG